MSQTAIVTAGGTIESIDDVRLMRMHCVEGTGSPEGSLLYQLDVENISKGTLGRLMAEALVKQGIETTLIGRRDLIKGIEDVPEGLRLLPFRSFTDLQQAIKDEAERTRANYFFMAAAVSDYSPSAIEGKLSSSTDELVLRLKKNPKLLDELRSILGSACTLVGFKLVSGLPTSELVRIAQKQNVRASLDFTVGNDYQEIDFERGFHPVHIVGRRGELESFSGSREDVAVKIIHYIRSQV